MIILISIILYLILFSICFFVELLRNSKWNKIFLSKSRLEPKGVTMIYIISFGFMAFFTIINYAIGENIELCVFTFFISTMSLLVAILISRKRLILTDKELIKYKIIGTTKICIKEIKEINDGYFLTVKSKNNIIVIETKFYDKDLDKLRKKLSILYDRQNKNQ